jgi:hypothetical protein
MDANYLNSREWSDDLQHARTLEKSANADIVQTAVDIAKARTQYFEKLVIGSGATIAALVSFLGTHSTRLQPRWILRCSLISLVVVLVTALYRNLRYPSYVLVVKHRVWMERQRERFRIQIKSYDFGIPTSDGSNQVVDQKSAEAEFKENDASLSSAIQKKTKSERRCLVEWRTAEYICLAGIIVAMISLVWLALCNF